MEITEVRIKLMDDLSERLQAFCSITFDDAFVIRDLKIIEGSSGPFVAMPSRKLTVRCPKCGFKNHLRASYCNQCGTRVQNDQLSKDNDGRAKLYADIAHPINSECREMVQSRIIEAFKQEVDRSQQPGYQSSYDDLDQDYEYGYAEEGHSKPSTPRPHFPQSGPKPHDEPPPEKKPSQTPTAPEQKKAKVESAEPPRGPHQPAAREEPSIQKKPDLADKRDDDRGGFGAGILD